MKAYPKSVMLVALALIMALGLSGCKLAASTPPPSAATPTVEALFPAETEGSISDFATQTAVASVFETPVVPGENTETPGVIIATNTPEPAQTEPGGQEAQPTDTPVVTTGGEQTGGGTVPNALPTPVIERPQTYTLKQGEWPICIARRYNLDLGSFFSVNGLNINSQPAAGTTLDIPATGTWGDQYGSRALKAHPTQYTVQTGDSVYSIACKFGDVAPELILAANGLNSAADVKPGMTITIP